MTALPPRPPAAPHRPPFRYTREQYHEMARLGHFAGKRVELIFGEIVEMSPVGWFHRVACRKLDRALTAAFAGCGWVDKNETLDLGHSEPVPDVAAYAGAFEDYTDHPATALLVVEVSDTTLDYDLTTKAELYATAGVPEYWVLDVNARELHVFRDPQTNAALNVTTYHAHTTHHAIECVSPLGAPHFTIAVADSLP
jgi:Uma2 family endonuclease